MKKIGINLEKTILKEIKEIITHPLIEESKMFQERYDTDEKISFCISYFDHWLNDNELENAITFFDQEGSNNDFYQSYFDYENKIIDFFIDRYNHQDIFIFSDHGKNSSIFEFNNVEDLECVTKLILRSDLMPINIYIRNYKAIFYSQTDLTWSVISIYSRVIKIKNLIKTYKINILE
ncbi:hypothetical protein BSPLISOX_1429 [uncultured Gammaproteobacteria bacterium]|jgi:hypothetical protein|nr:hypothetical protein BSPLISOX_1429 [uncultured Gammaproteobacteria bacterium]